MMGRVFSEPIRIEPSPYEKGRQDGLNHAIKWIQDNSKNNPGMTVVELSKILEQEATADIT